MSQKSALIFGVSGQDGAYLARLLFDKGYIVHGTSRDAEMSSFASLAALGIRDRVTTAQITSSGKVISAGARPTASLAGAKIRAKFCSMPLIPSIASGRRRRGRIAPLPIHRYRG